MKSTDRSPLTGRREVQHKDQLEDLDDVGDAMKERINNMRIEARFADQEGRLVGKSMKLKSRPNPEKDK